jgi:hypothetical protein
MVVGRSIMTVGGGWSLTAAILDEDVDELGRVLDGVRRDLDGERLQRTARLRADVAEVQRRQ